MADTHTDWNQPQGSDPTFRTRYNVARNSSGVTFEMTLEMTWTGTPEHYIDAVYGTECNVTEAIERATATVRAAITDQIAWAKNVETYVPKPGK